MTHQNQFLEVIDRDAAEQRFRAALRLQPLGEECAPIAEALGRTLSRDVVAAVDVPSFDRSNVDGFAVVAADTFGASEERPARIRLASESIAMGREPSVEIGRGVCASIATGGMIPRGADAVVMIEHTDIGDTPDDLLVRRAVAPGANVSFAGTDIASGETVLRRGETLTSRETGVLAAIGAAEVFVWRRPRVAVISTGDELIEPGAKMSPALVYDSNRRALADAVRELGGEPVESEAVPDDFGSLRQAVHQALSSCDVVLLSGGTSKGAGDIAYQVVEQHDDPGIVAHGVALKPGKPICLAVTGGKPLVVLPGFPTSAIFTFHEFVAPVIRRLAGLAATERDTIRARLAVKVNSEIGRTEYVLVGLASRGEAARDEHAAEGSAVRSASPGSHASAPLQHGSPDPSGDRVSLAAYPMGKGSGSVTSFARADGFITIGRHEEIVEAGTIVEVQRIGLGAAVADLVVIGSHCIGLDYLLGRMHDEGWRTKFLAVGSTGGLDAVRRGECDLAGAHLLDAATGEYNRPFLADGMELIAGYGRLQGIAFRRGDRRFEGREAREAVAAALADPSCRMVNRNAGSGTRVLIDQLLAGATPAGFSVQPRSHNAVAAAVSQGRADWGVTIETVAKNAGLGFLPLAHEQFDFVSPTHRLHRPPVVAFRNLLTDESIRSELRARGFRI